MQSGPKILFRPKSFVPWVLLGAMLFLLPMLFDSNSALIILCQMSITVIFALSYNMLLGQAGMLSFGHAVFMGVGGFAAVHTVNGWAGVPLPILPLFGGLFSLGVATCIGAFSTRRGGTSFAMISLGVVELVASFSIIIIAFFRRGGMLWDRTSGGTIWGIDFAHWNEVYYLAAGWVFVSVMCMYFFTRTPIGRMANAVRDNPERAEFVGYSARWVRFYSFCGAGFFAGVAGSLSAITFEIASAENLSVQASGTILMVTFLGGVGYFYGPIIGAIVFTLLQSVLSQQTELWEFYVGVLFLATVMYFPSGLAGLLSLHMHPIRNGKLSALLWPYLCVLVPSLVAAVGVIGLAELTHFLRTAAVEETQLVLFWFALNGDSALPWIAFAGVAVVGILGMHRMVPRLVSAWQDATMID